MQVSFRLLSNAMIIAKYKQTINEAYLAEQHVARDNYMEELKEIRERYTPLYASLQKDTNTFWEDVKEETGIIDESQYAILEDGTLTQVNPLTGGLWDL